MKTRRFSPGVPLSIRLEASSIPEPNTGCWLWTERVDVWGYGRLKWNGKHRLAHRLSWSEVYGEPDKHVLHKCDVAICINPDHLYLGSDLDNAHDREVRGRGNPPVGERNVNAVFTADDIIQIRASQKSNAALARELGVGRTTIRHIRTRETWRHIP